MTGTEDTGSGSPSPRVGLRDRLAAAIDTRAIEHLDASALRVLWALLLHADLEAGMAWPSRATIARHTGLAERTVFNVLGRLLDAGHIELARASGGRRPAVYRVLPAATPESFGLLVGGASTMQSDAPTVQPMGCTVDDRATVQSEPPTVQPEAPTVQSEPPTVQPMDCMGTLNPEPPNPPGGRGGEVALQGKSERDALRETAAAAGVDVDAETLERFAAAGGDAATLKQLVAALGAERGVNRPPRLAASLLREPDPDAWRRRLRPATTSAMPAHCEGQAPQLLGRYLIAEHEPNSGEAWEEAVVAGWRTGTYTLLHLAWFSRAGEKPEDVARVRRVLENAGEDPDAQPTPKRAAPSTNGRPPPRALVPAGGSGDA